MNENVEFVEQFKGKTIREVSDPGDDTNWADPAGFLLVFDDGSTLEVTADMGQGVGYVITDGDIQ